MSTNSRFNVLQQLPSAADRERYVRLATHEMATYINLSILYEHIYTFNYAEITGTTPNGNSGTHEIKAKVRELTYYEVLSLLNGFSQMASFQKL